MKDLLKIYGIAFVLFWIILLSGWLFCPNVRADIIYVDANIDTTKVELPKNTYLDFPLKNGVLIAGYGDIIFVSPSETHYSPFITRTKKLTIMKSGVGDNPTIKAAGSGAAFCILQQADSLIVDGLHFDLSECKKAVSYFGWRSEWNAKETEFIDCTLTKPPQKNFDAVNTSRKMMTVKLIDANTEHSHVTITSTSIPMLRLQARNSIMLKTDFQLWKRLILTAQFTRMG